MDVSTPLMCAGAAATARDGFAVARLLAGSGKEPEILFAGREGSLSEECRLQKEIAQKMGIKIYTEQPEKEYTVIIDAVFGVG